MPVYKPHHFARKFENFKIWGVAYLTDAAYTRRLQ